MRNFFNIFEQMFYRFEGAMGLNFIRPFLAKAMAMQTYPCSYGLMKRFHCNREATILMTKRKFH